MVYVDEPVLMNKWSSQHFSLGNAQDDRPDDLPHLLRRIADSIDERGIKPTELLDLVVHQETHDFGPWWSVTVYWSSDARPGS